MDLDFDRAHIWHPYSHIRQPGPLWGVTSAQGVHLHLHDGRRLIDGMASWWSAIHGYNHPNLNRAITRQLQDMAHVMFGGLTHTPAIELTRQLLDITDPSLQYVFYADSGSVAVEVAMKMAAQHCFEQGQLDKRRFLTFRSGYHGDTFAAMSVCDPDTGMHHKFSHLLHRHLFIDCPPGGFDRAVDAQWLQSAREAFAAHHKELIAVIIEPVVQGAGGMRFYAPEYLRCLRDLCDEFGVLLIFDEIATGFARSGEMFAYQHAGAVPDILCLGKALTGGCMSFAAVLTNDRIADGISSHFMHGPTFMANPLACAVALESVQLLLNSDWRDNVRRINHGLRDGLAPCAEQPAVREVRVLGAIGVVEMRSPVDLAVWQPRFVEAGVWVRPFGHLVYVMPPYVISDAELERLCAAMVQVIALA